MPLAYVNQNMFTDRVSNLLEEVDYRIAETDADLDAIFRLRYEAYRREEFIHTNVSGTFTDDYDQSGNARIYGVYLNDRLVSSIRIHVASRADPDCPSLSTFSDILRPAIDAGKVLVDPTRFVTDRHLSRDLKGLPYITLRLCWIAAVHFQAEHFLVAIRAEHQAFYRRTFRHRAVCPPRAYAMLNCPISLMTVNCDEVAESVYRRYPFFRSNGFERRMLFDGLSGPAVASGELDTAMIPSGISAIQDVSAH